MSRFANLVIDRVVLHEVFPKDSGGNPVPPAYGTTITEIDSDGLATIRERVVKAMGSDSHCIQMRVSDDGVNSAFRVCCSLLDCEAQEFVIESQNLAGKLSQAQAEVHRRVPGGTVIVLAGSVGPASDRFIGVIKAEIHAGFVKENTDDKLSMKYLKDLLLTPQQKLYKIAVLIELEPAAVEGSRTLNDYEVWIYDHNLTRSDTSEMAQYFHQGFFGCSFAETSKKLTSDFYSKSRDFINSTDKLNAEQKIDATSSLYTYLKSPQKNVLQVREFAEEYLIPEVRDDYCNHMEEQTIPSQGIMKDLTGLKRVLQRRQVKFTNGVKLSGPAEKFDDSVEVSERDSDGHIYIKIKGDIEAQN